MRPALADEWHPTRNGGLRPSEVAPGSSRPAWWRCARGHEWEAEIYRRVRGAGCPYCAGRRASPERNLAVSFPEVALDWHPERNGTVLPHELTPGSDRVVWWRGPCGHEWRAPVRARVRGGRRCPLCAPPADDRQPAGRAPLTYRSLAYQFPGLAAEWHPTRNVTHTRGDLRAAGSTAVWWRCRVCATDWRASVAERTAGRACPRCEPPRLVAVVERVVIRLRPWLVVGDGHDVPRPVRQLVGRPPDLVLPTHRVAYDIDWPGVGVVAPRVRPGFRQIGRREAFGTYRWSLVGIGPPVPAPGRPPEVEVADLTDAAMIAAAVFEHLQGLNL